MTDSAACLTGLLACLADGSFYGFFRVYQHKERHYGHGIHSGMGTDHAIYGRDDKGGDDMPGVTKEQIARAKEWDLLSYLQAYEPQELKRCGKEYRTVSHDSLKISNGKWHWHSRGIGGRTALDYLVKVRQMGFVEAVEALSGEMVYTAREKAGPEVSVSDRAARRPAPSGSLILPEADRYGAAMVSYLQRRGIDAGIISRCIGLGILYESRKYRNCVFVGRDRAGSPRYACLRGTDSQYKGEAAGSDKRYGFFLPPQDGKCVSVSVAESPIDALSAASIRKMRGECREGTAYLSLGGTAPAALLQFLEDHPAVTGVELCLDNDSAGLAGMERIRQEIRESPMLSGRKLEIKDCPPPVSCGKDYNDFLQKERAGEPGRGGRVWQL